MSFLPISSRAAATAVHCWPRATAPAAFTPAAATAYWRGWDIARGIAFDGHGNVLDGLGGLHPFTYTVS